MMKYFQGYYFYRYIKWKLGSKSPITTVLKITNKCNLKCKHCTWHKRNKNDISTEKWFDLIKISRDKGCINCIIEGGEPLLRKDIDLIIQYARDLGMWTTLITNGTLDFSKYNPDVFWISIDGVEKSHDKIRGKGNFKKTVHNIKKNKRKNLLTVTTLTKINVEDLEKICKFFSPLVTGLGFNFMYPYQKVDKIALSKKERIETANRLIHLKKKYNIINSNSFLNSVGKGWVCKPWLTLNIDCDGKIHHGCTVEQIEPCNCSNCDMACYGELSQAFNLKKDAIDLLKKSLSLSSSRFLFLRKS